MSWVYHIAGDAAVVIRRMDVRLQEAVYDKLDELANEAEEREFASFAPESFSVTIQGRAHVVLLSLLYNRANRVLTLLDVDHAPAG